jgi:hypothetical protein
MAVLSTFRALLVVFALSTAAIAQTSPQQAPPDAPCPATNQSQQSSQTASKPCTPPASDAKKPTAAEQFPFPGEPSKPAASAPDSPAATPAKNSAADEHPFPTAPPPKLPGDDSSSSSSSSSSSNDDTDTPPDVGPPLKDEGTEGTSTHRKLPKPARVQTDDERVDEDITVAKFYMNDENFAGAYLRAKDAVKVQPDYSLGHFTLAQIAQKMKKKDEAIAEFKTYLKLDPEGEKKREAQQALDQMK